MQIKKGDTVRLMKGKEAAEKRGSGSVPTGKVIEVLKEDGRVRVEGLRIVTKHLKAGRSQQNQNGGRIEKTGTIALANVQLVCPKCNKPTRIGAKAVDKGGDKGVKNVRICKKCKAEIDS